MIQKCDRKILATSMFIYFAYFPILSHDLKRLPLDIIKIMQLILSLQSSQKKSTII